MKEIFSVPLEPEDIARIKQLAIELELPPHTLARSLLLRMLNHESQNSQKKEERSKYFREENKEVQRE